MLLCILSVCESASGGVFSLPLETPLLLLFSCTVVPTLCHLDCSSPGFSVLHCLLEFAQTPVHWVTDAICALVLQSCLSLCNAMAVAMLRCPWDFPGKNSGVVCHALLEGILLTQGSNPCFLCLLNYKQIFCHWATGESLCCLTISYLYFYENWPSFNMQIIILSTHICSFSHVVLWKVYFIFSD